MNRATIASEDSLTGKNAVLSDRQQRSEIEVYFDPVFLRHQTGSHPECPQRLEHLTKYLRAVEFADRLNLRTAPPASIETIAAVHQRAYVEAVREICQRGGGASDPDTPVSHDSFDAAATACGVVCQAVETVVRNPATASFCAVRPPGHHARPAAGMGFCLFNSVAVAAQAAIDQLGLARVLIVDWDVHHGNGTQEIFWERDDVAYFSIHRFPFYPGTGSQGETGSAAGLGSTCNVPVEFGTARAKFHEMFETHLERFVSRVQPELIILSAGFDAFRDDPVGSLGLLPEDFARMTKFIVQSAETFSQGRMVGVLEGGYHLDGLCHCTGAYLAQWLSCRNGEPS